MVAVVEPEFFLSEVVGRRVYRHSERIGRLQDLVIVETGKLPEVSQLLIRRPYGRPSLLVPWDKVVVISTNEIAIDVDNPDNYQQAPGAGAILLRDYILDKKILDMDGREVEVVYDVKLAFQGGKLYASEVDFSRHRLLRRLGCVTWPTSLRSKAAIPRFRGCTCSPCPTIWAASRVTSSSTCSSPRCTRCTRLTWPTSSRNSTAASARRCSTSSNPSTPRRPSRRSSRACSASSWRR
jgi:sporulation protein YlmC with PRC-barrel domain